MASARLAVVVSLFIGLAGCASELMPEPDKPSVDNAPIAVFTGEFVDGKPLYRLPRMEVVGSRRSIGPDT